VLLESLQKFTGTVVFVSHDRYFIDKLATRVFEIGPGEIGPGESGEGRIEVFPGNYEDYLWRKQGKSGAEPDLALRSNSDRAAESSSPAAQTAQPDNDAPAKAKRINPIKLKQMKERCRELEEEIVRLEAAVAQAETALQSFVNAEETQRQTQMLDRWKSELLRSMNEWEKLAQALEELEV
jgi:ATP-binding cassette subfamily F protein 3